MAIIISSGELESGIILENDTMTILERSFQIVKTSGRNFGYRKLFAGILYYNNFRGNTAVIFDFSRFQCILSL